MGKVYKGEVMKFGFLVRFFLEGEVWLVLCVWSVWEGMYILFLDGRILVWFVVKELDVRFWFLVVGVVVVFGYIMVLF